MVTAVPFHSSSCNFMTCKWLYVTCLSASFLICGSGDQISQRAEASKYCTVLWLWNCKQIFWFALPLSSIFSASILCLPITIMETAYFRDAVYLFKFNELISRSIFFFFQIEDRFCIYLEYVHPGSINKFAQVNSGAMTESIIRNFTRHILSGLSYLHSKKTIHRLV